MNELKVWKLHPQACRISEADKNLCGQANEAAVKWCVPYSTANSLGWYLYPPVDIDILWRGGKLFEHRPCEFYDDSDYRLVRNLVRPEDGVNPDQWSLPGGRTKFSWGVVEPGVVQLWTGCIFQTPPGWCLKVSSPINFASIGYQIQEGVLETDWMFYDIWINIKFNNKLDWVYLRRNQLVPLAQIIPIQRDSLSGWGLQESMVNRDTPEGEEVFKYWINYNHSKFGKGGRQHLSTTDPTITKASTTYFREKKKHIDF